MDENNEEAIYGGTRSAAVEAKTGKGWLAWFELLDAAGARELSHKEIVAHLKGFPEVNAWWQQKITGTYEMERGDRQQHQMPDGFQIGKSKTFAAPVDELYEAFVNPDRRMAWLEEGPQDVRETKPGETIWMTWSDGKTTVGASFEAKGDNKSRVSIRHTKLPDADAAERTKLFWAEKLAALGAMLMD